MSDVALACAHAGGDLRAVRAGGWVGGVADVETVAWIMRRYVSLPVFRISKARFGCLAMAGQRILLDIPESELPAIARLLLMRGKAISVTVEDIPPNDAKKKTKRGVAKWHRSNQ